MIKRFVYALGGAAVGAGIISGVSSVCGSDSFMLEEAKNISDACCPLVYPLMIAHHVGFVGVGAAFGAAFDEVYTSRKLKNKD